MNNKNKAASILLKDKDDRYVVVWNRRYKGFTFPGGKVEEGEEPIQAVVRELAEETGMTIDPSCLEEIYVGHHDMKVESSRGSTVHVFEARSFIAEEEPREMEEDCPVGKMTKEEFLEKSPFSNFYKDII